MSSLYIVEKAAINEVMLIAAFNAERLKYQNTENHGLSKRIR